MKLNIKQLSNLLFALSFLCAIPLFTGKSYGYRTEIQLVFFLAGAFALILSLIASRMESYKDDFNILFWIGSLVLFIGLILRTYYLPYDTYVIIGGMGISGLSYFINPFQSDNKPNDELLDN